MGSTNRSRRISTLVYTNSKLFRVSKRLGFFVSRPSHRIRVHLSRILSVLVLIACVSSQLLLWLRNFLKSRRIVVMDIVYQGYAVCSLLVTFMAFSSHFRSLLDENVQFVAIPVRNVRSYLTPLTILYLSLAAVKIFGIVFIISITKRDNSVGFATYMTYVFLSIEEILLFLVLCQLYSMSCLIASSVDAVKTSNSSVLTKCERLIKHLEFSAALYSFYERQTLFSYAYLLLEMVNSGYYNAMFLFMRPALLRYRYFLANCIVNMTVFFEAFVPLSIAVLACERIDKAVNAFYEELFTVVKKSSALCRNKKVCLYLTLRKSVNFSACGFFTLGYPLITSIIAAATTYLVILVQFSNNDPIN